MILDKDTKILIVGLGLMGGSYAQALTAAGYEVGAIDANPKSIEFALENGFIKTGKVDIEPEYIASFDMIIFALYPHTFLEWIRDNQQYIKSGALLSDVTGVKVCIVYKIQEILRDDLEFIAAHPMAGREVCGVENATKEIFKDANYIVTPTDKNTEKAIETCKQLGHVLGFKTVTALTPEEHDEMIGFLSQLTHCIAVSLMICKDSRSLADYTGDSFRDLTRIAKINDVMWSELFLLNKEELLKQMRLFEEKFDMLRKSIENDDTESIRKIMIESRHQREFFDKKEEK